MALLTHMGKDILVVNSGSSSLKLSLFQWAPSQSPELTWRATALAEELHSSNARLRYNNAFGNTFQKDLGALGNTNRVEAILSLLAQEEPHFAPHALTAVGHRVVHGGTHTHSIQIDANVLQQLKTLIPLAPLHNPAAIEGIQNAMEATGSEIPHVAVFDTAFHRTLPPPARYYGIPYSLTQAHHIERYGFHGIAHKALWEVYKEKVAQAKVPPRKIITLHLGSGCSVTAIAEGISIETSMGYTPAEGLLMGTRAGNIDIGAVEALCRFEQHSIQEMLQCLNEQSGLLGVSGISSDLRCLLQEAEHSERARLALDIFCHRIRLYIGAYFAILEGAEALVFSGGIGENSGWVRQKVLSGMQWCGIALDDTRNTQASHLSAGEVRALHKEGSLVGLYAIGSDENRAIAQEVGRILKGKD